MREPSRMPRPRDFDVFGVVGDEAAEDHRPRGYVHARVALEHQRADIVPARAEVDVVGVVFLRNVVVRGRAVVALRRAEVGLLHAVELFHFVREKVERVVVAVDFHDNLPERVEPEFDFVLCELRLERKRRVHVVVERRSFCRSNAERQRTHHHVAASYVRRNFDVRAVLVHIPIGERRLFGLFNRALIPRPHLVYRVFRNGTFVDENFFAVHLEREAFRFVFALRRVVQFDFRDCRELECRKQQHSI